MFRWTPVHLNGAPIPYGSAVVAVEHKVYCFGILRVSNSAQLDVHVFHTVSLRWMTLPPVTNERGERPVEVPSRRHSHTAVLIEYFIYIWGGDPYCNLLYAFDVGAHSWLEPKVSGTVPEKRYNHSACVFGKVMYIHGGCTQLTGRNNDIYKLDTTTMVWSLINTRGTTPPVSSGHSATIIGTKMFVFGGVGGQGEYFNSIRVFETETNCWLSTPSAQLIPEGRRFHSACVYNGELYMCGGWNGNQAFHDVWKFNPDNFSWKKVKPKGKGPSHGNRMCCCMVGDCTILIAGKNRYFTLNDNLHILDLSPTLKTLCKLAVIQYGVEQKELPHDIRWELTAMTRYSHEL